MIDDIKIWDRVRFTSDGLEALVSSVMHDHNGTRFICKWHVANVLHMATFERSQVIGLGASER